MSERKKIIIVGGVAGGASAAARARRLSEDAEITLFERGEHISFANCGLPYHIGGVITDRERLLVQTPEAMRRRFRIDIHTNTEVLRINRIEKTVTVKNIQTEEEQDHAYDYLILSPGAEPVCPPIPGVNHPLVKTLRNLKDMDGINQSIDQLSCRNVVVVGGGYIGLEMTEALVERGLDVTLVELMPQVMGPIDLEMASTLHQAIKQAGVNLMLETSVTGFKESPEGLIVQLSNGEKINSGLAILAIGVKPETKLARECGLDIGATGGILVNDQMQTSDPDILAVGDAVEVQDLLTDQPCLIPLAGPANRQGRIAADTCFGRESHYRKTQGTAICKVFDYAVGMTGLSEKILKKQGLPYEKVYVHPANHASYYPGAQPISLKVLFSPEDGQLLGAQAVGLEGIDKRIDVLATAIRAEMTVYDLEHLELCYAPPYGSAKDPVNYAGFTAANALRGDVRLCHVPETIDPGENQVLLDVRTPDEVATGTIPGALNIPLDELRENLNKIPENKELLVFCQVGLRGYVACRILSQHGFACRNLTGGYKTYKAFTETQPAPSEQPRQELRDDTGVGEPSQHTPPVSTAPTAEIDASGLQCPGPIMRLSKAIQQLENGQSVLVKATDPGFCSDIEAWCASTGNTLVESKRLDGAHTALVRKGTQTLHATSGPSSLAKHKTIVVFSNDLDKVMAAFIIANGAATMGSQVTLFFTFWGLNVLRRHESVSVKKGFLEAMFGMMMPRGSARLILSKMHMLGMGTGLMKYIMRSKNVSSLPELIEQAQSAGVRLVACSMSMDVMGIKREELIDGVEEGGVAMFLHEAEQGNVNLFI